MRRLFRLVAVAAAIGWAVSWWRRNRRFGTQFVNRIVNPALMERRWTGAGASELGMIEHVGRRSGTRRVTPVHPEPTTDGFRIVVPLGEESEWARNVLAAGHCRLQLHGTVHELDEPRLVEPTAVDGLPRALRLLESYLGFRYLVLRAFGSSRGTLEASEASGQPTQPKPKRRGHPIHLEDTEPVVIDPLPAEVVPAS